MIENLISDCLEIIKSGKEELSTTEDSTIAQAFSIIKGLTIKGAPSSYIIIKKIIEALKDASVAVLKAVTKHWFIIFSTHDFSKKNKFNISPFYKQRLFSIAFPALIKNYRETQISFKNGQ